jgi:hypothetical protein
MALWPNGLILIIIIKQYDHNNSENRKHDYAGANDCSAHLGHFSNHDHRHFRITQAVRYLIVIIDDDEYNRPRMGGQWRKKPR